MSDILETGSPTNRFSCRKLEAGDLENVMHWRMLPYITEYMNTDPVLTLEGQRQWYDKLVAAGELYHWIIEVDDTPCGLVYLADIDMVNKRCSYGHYVAVKKLRSFKLTLSLQMSMYDYVFERLGLNKMTTEVFCLNAGAIKMNDFYGCKTEGILRQHILKNGQYYDVCIQSMLAEEWKNLRHRFKYQQINYDNSTRDSDRR